MWGENLPSESPGPTQAKLYNHKDGQRLEISDLGSRWHVLCSKNKDTDQLLGHCISDLRLCFSHIQKSRFTHDAAHSCC